VTHGVQDLSSVKNKAVVSAHEMDKCCKIMAEYGVMRHQLKFGRSVTRLASEKPMYVVALTNDAVFSMCDPKLSREACLARGMRNAGCVPGAERDHKVNPRQTVRAEFKASSSKAMLSLALRMFDASISDMK
jgi:hypothetical protein